jgi:uncharacterized membrane protein YedE/YeeE
MKGRLAALFAGALFGAGLVISGMTDPAKVRAFLDLAGAWDPSLALVMAGAIGVHLVLSRLVLRRTAPLFAGAFDLPKRTDIDARLISGAAIFGVGWGLGGVCPGPAVVSLGTGSVAPVVFVLAMIAGTFLDRVYVSDVRRAAARRVDVTA